MVKAKYNQTFNLEYKGNSQQREELDNVLDGKEIKTAAIT